MYRMFRNLPPESKSGMAFRFAVVRPSVTDSLSYCISPKAYEEVMKLYKHV